MNKLLTVIYKHRYFAAFLILYVGFRCLLLNVNYTEWGDTFRMVRGADYLSHFSWPWDEKRWPLYSLFLVPGIWLKAPVLWGRMIGIVISASSLAYLYGIYIKFVSRDKKFALLAVILTATTSVFAYWSIRVMADPLFALLILMYSYYFLNWYKSSNALSNRQIVTISLLLLLITMTRFEGIFMAAGTGLFFFRRWKWRDIAAFAVPQLLVYIPWTIYAKVLYKGSVQNDYLNEAKGFIFNLERFEYFFVYTAFLLVVPVAGYFAYRGILALKRKLVRGKVDIVPYVPVVAFIAFEVLTGFIWTPSLPRIYMPIIPFFAIFMAYGIQKYRMKWRYSYIASGLSLTFLFAAEQYKLKLYFLGASRALFLLVLAGSISLIIISYLPKYSKSIMIGVLISLNILISTVIITNQRLVYKTVKQAIETLQTMPGIVAYSDETGNTEWYLRDREYYLPQTKSLTENEQYEMLKVNNVTYLLWTNEFNRGSVFKDPKNDSRYTLLAIYSQPIRDPFDVLLSRLGLLEDTDYTVFITKVYRVD